MKRKIKPVPHWLRQRTLVLIFQSRPAVILSNWLFQGTRMMLPVERFLKLTLEIIYSALFFILFSSLGLRELYLLIVSILAGHTMNWLTNGHFFVLMRYCCFREIDYKRFLSFPKSMAQRLSRWQIVVSVVAFGSISRGAIHENSDLDVRIITQDNLAHQWVGALLVWRERLFAFLTGYPLDIYLATLSRGLEKLRTDELPIIIMDRDHVIEKLYSNTLHFRDIEKSVSS